MRIHYLAPALLAGTVLASHAATAQGAWYIGGSAGALFMSDLIRSTSFVNHATGIVVPGTNTSTFNPGEAFNVSLGRNLPFGLRLEAELGYLHYTPDSINPLSTGGALPNLNGTKLTNPTGGDHDRITATLNLFYDLPVSFAGIRPYLGGGVGFYHASATDAVFTMANGAPFTQHGGSGDNALMFGEIGASYPLTPRLSVVPAYRYTEFFAEQGNQGAHIVKIGLRYAF
jgi:opacity protein-like surface antigen